MDNSNILSKKYSDIFPGGSDEKNSSSASSAKVDAEVIVIGAGIAGASIAHCCATSDPSCRVIVLEQYDYSKASQNLSPTKNGNEETCPSDFRLNHGSSRGGPRRIGVIGGDARVMRAWKAWIAMTNKASASSDEPNGNLMDIAGEVYVFALFPFGWMFMAIFGMYFVYHYFFTTQPLPDGLQFLWTSKSIEEKLGSRQGFQKGCWSGSVGISYKDSAALHTDRILQYLLDDSQKQHGNLEIRYSSCVSHIEMETNDTVKVTVQKKAPDTTGSSDETCVSLVCKHLVIASGGWTGDLLKGLLESKNKKDDADYKVDHIQTQMEVFTCPVYKITQQSNDDTTISRVCSASSGCPLFSCVSKKLYGFPINYQAPGNDNKDSFLYIRPFFKAFESDDPNDQQISDEQKKLIDDFVKDCIDQDSGVSYSHCYTCRYPKLSLDHGKSFKPVFDFVPGSNQRIVVHAGLDGYCFKFGSIYGMEFLELLDTGKPPKDCQWPSPGDQKKENILFSMFRKLVQKEEAESSS